MDRVLEKGRREQEWGTPAILDACIAVAKADPSLGTRVTGFLSERPAGQIKPGIVPKINDQPWAADVFARWKDANVSSPVKKAIEAVRGVDGHVVVELRFTLRHAHGTALGAGPRATAW